MAKQEKQIKTAADLKQDSHNYRKHSEQNKARIRKSIDEAGLGRSVVIDADGVLVAGNGVQIHLLGHICELIFCFSQEGTRAFSHSQWELGKMNNRIDVGMQSNNEYSKIHHATFPVALPAYIISNFTEKSIIDCFGGTGTTMIAAEQLGRKCYMMELDPHYCDVIIARWEKLTGNKAEKINVGS